MVRLRSSPSSSPFQRPAVARQGSSGAVGIVAMVITTSSPSVTLSRTVVSRGVNTPCENLAVIVRT